MQSHSSTNHFENDLISAVDLRSYSKRVIDAFIFIIINGF